MRTRSSFFASRVECLPTSVALMQTVIPPCWSASLPHAGSDYTSPPALSNKWSRVSLVNSINPLISATATTLNTPDTRPSSRIVARNFLLSLTERRLPTNLWFIRDFGGDVFMEWLGHRRRTDDVKWRARLVETKQYLLPVFAVPQGSGGPFSMALGHRRTVC